MSDSSGVRTGRRQLLALTAAATLDGALGAVLGRNTIVATGADAAERGKLPIGMNLSGIADWEPGFPFLNLLWGAREWLTRNASGEGPYNTELVMHLELDENGYPYEIPFKPVSAEYPQQVFTLLPNVLKAGKFVILYDGAGEIGATGATKIIKSQPGRIEIFMQHNRDLTEGIVIRKSMRGNHVRNIRILPIDDEKADLEANPFRREVIEFCKPWHCLRFMDWQATNASINQRWAARKTRSFYTQTGVNGDIGGMYGTALPAWQKKWSSGVAVELCLQLANLTKTDAWLCVPHLADDNYIIEMAKLVKAKLDPSLKVYLEFSNEIWNWSFIQSQWMLRSEVAGDLVVNAGGQAPWKARTKPSRFVNGIVADGAGEGVDHPERIGALIRRCFGLWEEVFSGNDRIRLIRVCAVQATWTDTVQRTLNWVVKNGGCDALSPAGYFGPDDTVYAKWETAGAKLTKSDVIADMKPMVTSYGKYLGINLAIAKKAGVKLVVYEGGQHIQPLNQALTPYTMALGEAQTDPAMYELYRDNLNQYAKDGCGVFCAYSSVGQQGSRWGSWGHAEYYGQPPVEAPKYRALLDANTAKGRL